MIMSKTIVSIISEQTIPNYLFIKEMFHPGDQLLFISSKKMSNRIEWIEITLKWSLCDPRHVVLENDGDEEDWASMSTQIEKALSKGEEYLVNLTGGTKYMALAVQSVFTHYKSRFYYIPYPQNRILSANELESKPIDHRVSVEEYVHLYNQPLKAAHEPIMPKAYTEKFFQLFLAGWEKEIWEIIDKLRAYRDAKKCIPIEEIESADDGKLPRIEGLKAFLDQISFENDGTLSKYQAQYLTGGWFEECIYHRIKDMLNPKDIMLGPKTTSTNNDLDVVFTLGNKLYVVECKTGVEGRGMLNEIVYKASALKENLLGLSARSFIFSLGQDNEMWSQAAKNMGITYYGRSTFVDDNLFQCVMNAIRKSSFD